MGHGGYRQGGAAWTHGDRVGDWRRDRRERHILFRNGYVAPGAVPMSMRFNPPMMRDNPEMAPYYWGLLGVMVFGLVSIVLMLVFAPPWG